MGLLVQANDGVGEGGDECRVAKEQWKLESNVEGREGIDFTSS